MKILEIIIPHETLDENLKTDALELAKRAGTKARDVANDVGERFNIKWLRRAESQGVSNHIDQLLTTAGKDLKRSDALADAERVLLDLEKSVKYDRAGKKQFEEIGDNLADALYAQKESSIGGANPIDVLERLYRNSPNPPAWMSNRTLQLKRLDDEWLAWMSKSVDAKIVVRREVDLATPLDPKAKPKSKVEKEEEKIADKDRENRKKQTDLDAKKIAKAIADNDAAEKTFASRFKVSIADNIFLTSEALKIYIQFQRSMNGINDWEKSGQIPSDVATFFPQVPADMQVGSHMVGGDKGKDERIYSNNEERVKQAANWARTKIWKQLIYQLSSGSIAFITAHTLKGIGGGLIGVTSHIGKMNSLIAWMSKRSKPTTDAIAKWFLQPMSQASKFLFVDYFLSAVNNQQFNSNDVAAAVNIVLPDAVWGKLNIEHTADANKAMASLLLADSHSSLETFSNSDFAKQVGGAIDAAYVPPGIFIELVRTIGGFIKEYLGFSLPDVRIPPAEGETIPGVGEPATPQTSTQTNTVPPVEVKPPENTDVTNTAPPAPPAPEVGTDTNNNNNKIKREKLEETLKYKVLSRMRS